MLSWLTLSLSLSSAFGAPPSIDEPLRSGKTASGDAAVVIGIEDYAFLPDVSYAQRDAQAFRDLAVYTLGIPSDRVRLLQGASREQIENALSETGALVGESGTLWVYFAGHGAAGTDGSLRLVGDDARRDPAVFEGRSVPVSVVGQGVAGNVRVIIDACWAGKGRDGTDLLPGTRFAVPSGMAKAKDRTAVWTAATAEEISGPYDAVRHGVFTYFAVGALRGWADGELDGKRDGKVTTAEADSYVQRALRSVQVTSQTPQLAGSREITLVSTKGLEQGPKMDDLPAAAVPHHIVSQPGPVPVPVVRPPGALPIAPVKFLGGGLYGDGAGTSWRQDKLLTAFKGNARIDQAKAGLGTWSAVQVGGGVVAGSVLIGIPVSLIANGIRRSDYEFCANDEFFCDKPSDYVAPVGAGTAILPWAGVAAVGTGLILAGEFGKTGVRHRLAKIATEELK